MRGVLGCGRCALSVERPRVARLRVAWCMRPVARRSLHRAALRGARARLQLVVPIAHRQVGAGAAVAQVSECYTRKHSAAAAGVCARRSARRPKGQKGLTDTSVTCASAACGAGGRSAAEEQAGPVPGLCRRTHGLRHTLLRSHPRRLAITNGGFAGVVMLHANMRDSIGLNWTVTPISCASPHAHVAPTMRAAGQAGRPGRTAHMRAALRCARPPRRPAVGCWTATPHSQVG